MDKKRIAEIKKEIKKLKSQWPAHSVPAAMLLRLDELEEELESLQNTAPTDKKDGMKR